MTDLAAWLLAQIADDEAAWQMVAARDEVLTLHGKPIAPRMLADCAAKRAIVELCVAMIHAAIEDREKEHESDVRYALRLLAQPYADREGFDPSWRVA